jgi:hypothetical protein
MLLFAAISPWAFLNATDFPGWERTAQNAALWSSDLNIPTWSTRVEIAATPIFFRQLARPSTRDLAAWPILSFLSGKRARQWRIQYEFSSIRIDSGL